MKTTIELTDYVFSGKNNPLFQISDDPESQLARVIEINRAEYCFDVDMIVIRATTYFINPTIKKVIYNTPTTVEGKDWIIFKGDITIQIDQNLKPVPNPDFDPALPVDRATNYPYLLTDSYEQFKTVTLMMNQPILQMFINSNDSLNLYY